MAYGALQRTTYFWKQLDEQSRERDIPGQRLFCSRQRICPCHAAPVTAMVIVMTVMVAIALGIVFPNHPGVVSIKIRIGIEKVRQVNAILS